jgi:hypothetical protein
MNASEFIEFREAVFRARDHMRRYRHGEKSWNRIDASDRAFRTICHACGVNPIDEDGNTACTLAGAGVPYESVIVYSDSRNTRLAVEIIEIKYGFLFSTDMAFPDRGRGYSPNIEDELFANRNDAIVAGANEILQCLEPAYQHLAGKINAFIDKMQPTQLDLFGGSPEIKATPTQSAGMASAPSY